MSPTSYHLASFLIDGKQRDYPAALLDLVRNVTNLCQGIGHLTNKEFDRSPLLLAPRMSVALRQLDRRVTEKIPSGDDVNSSGDQPGREGVSQVVEA